ncbi:MAG: hypothetical protein KKB20_28980 [Proteobacteria bacterium]|nr:hypothetical protein [Pseudomonadota bacterium]
MKEITLDDGRVLKTPWLRVNEAAAYCGVSRRWFEHHAFKVNLPHGGTRKTRLYHVKILDALMSGEYGDLNNACAEDDSPPPRRRRRRLPNGKLPEDMSLVDPVTGKIYTAKM